MYSLVVLALLAAAETTPAAPEPGSPQGGGWLTDRGTLIWTVRRDELSSGEDGSGVAVDWVAKLGRGPTLVLGGERSELDDSRWAFARAGVASAFGERTHFGVDLRLGRGTRAGEDFDYLLAEATWTRRLIGRKLYLELQNRYVDVDLSRGNLVQATAIWLPTSRLTARFSRASSTSGNLDAGYFIGQVEARAGRWRWLAGLASGRNRPPSLLTVGGPEGDFDQRFAAVTLPLGELAAMVAFDDLELETVRRRSWTLVLRHSLGGGGGSDG